MTSGAPVALDEGGESGFLRSVACAACAAAAGWSGPGRGAVVYLRVQVAVRSARRRREDQGLERRHLSAKNLILQKRGK